MELILKKQFVEEDNHSKDVLHILAENAPVKAHNEFMLAQLDVPITSIEATD